MRARRHPRLTPRRAQETGFFDATKTGELTSRLSADCSTVSDQVSLNANILARSAMQAAAVLAFMLAANWRLTIVTLVLIPINIQARPAIAVLCFAHLQKCLQVDR